MKIHTEKMAAEFEDEFVMMLLGMRINRFWKIHKWLPMMLAMPRMLKELQSHPETGYLGHQQFGFLVIVYFRSFDQLEAYAHGKDYGHFPAWVRFGKSGGYTSGDVGLWHELYRVRPGNYEAVYTAMPATGIGRFGNLVPAKLYRDSSRKRMESISSNS